MEYFLRLRPWSTTRTANRNLLLSLSRPASVQIPISIAIHVRLLSACLIWDQRRHPIESHAGTGALRPQSSSTVQLGNQQAVLV
jgi:hypothetical protein